MKIKEYTYKERFRRLKLFFLLTLGGLAIVAVGFLGFSGPAIKPFMFGFILCIPFVFYSYYLALVHWKDRYKGQNSDEWAIAFALTASNWGVVLIILYYFYNIIPDMRGTGIYNDD